MESIEVYRKQDDYHEALSRASAKKVFYLPQVVPLKDQPGLFSYGANISAMVIENEGIGTIQNSRLLLFTKSFGQPVKVDSAEAEKAFMASIQENLLKLISEFQKMNASAQLIEGQVGYHD